MGNSVTTINATGTPSASRTNTATKIRHHPNCQSTLGGRSQKSRKSDKNNGDGSNPESSRVLFLLYLIHRTWNVVVDTVDPKSRR